MIVFAIFLEYLFAFAVALVFFEWFVSWFGSVSTVVAVLTFTAAFVAVAAVLVLLVDGLLWGIIVAVAIILFWSFVIFGATGATAIYVLVFAGALLFVGVMVAIARLRRSTSALPPNGN
jgi:hypothetical protein